MGSRKKRPSPAAARSGKRSLGARAAGPSPSKGSLKTGSKASSQNKASEQGRSKAIPIKKTLQAKPPAINLPPIVLPSAPEGVDESKAHHHPDHDVHLSSSTGIAALDKLLHGGFPTGAVVLLSGSSGSGKTIFSFQWLFHGIKEGETGLYITLTEPLFKTLKNLESLDFYDRKAIEEEKVKIMDLRDQYNVEKFDEKRILSYIEKEVQAAHAKRLCLDSITAIAYQLDDPARIRRFIFELGKMLATLGCTTILTSEVRPPGEYSIYGVEEFISDAILRVDQIKIGDELQRRLQLIKMRGRGYHTEDLFFKIGKSGLIVYPKLRVSLDNKSTSTRVSTGIKSLDGLISKGLFQGSTTLVTGSTGTGKSLFGIQFLLDGLRKGERCLLLGFEESRDQILRNAKAFGWDLAVYEKKGLLTIRCAFPAEHLLEEHLADIQTLIEKRDILRCVVDSLSAIANSSIAEEFQSFSNRLNIYLKSRGVTSMFTATSGSSVGSSGFSENNLSTITDNILMLRFVEMQGELRHVLNIVKMRGSGHSKGLKKYDIVSSGIAIGGSLSSYEGIMTGVTRKVSDTMEERLALVFRESIGPMAAAVFDELRQKGLSREHILSYIDGLEKEGIMKQAEADSFRQGCIDILEQFVDEG
ncbi:MAG: circadian clock protein KaiC [archaeon]